MKKKLAISARSVYKFIIMKLTYPLTATGVIRFDPPRPGMKRRTQWWCVVETDNEIARLYRWFLDRHWWEADQRSYKREYHTGAWGAHISLVRGEKPRKNLQDWGKRWNGQRVQFRYSPRIRQTGDTTGFDRADHFWFLDVDLPLMFELREHFGLPVKSWDGKSYSSHMTIARAYS